MCAQKRNWTLGFTLSVLSVCEKETDQIRTSQVKVNKNYCVQKYVNTSVYMAVNCDVGLTTP